MSESRNNFLSHKDFAANRALFALCLALFGAGRFYCREDFLGVTLGRTVIGNCIGGITVVTLCGFGAVRRAGCITV